MPHQEDQLYEQIAQYISLKYPTVLYRFDLGGLYTPSHLQRNLYGRLNSPGYPDLFIAQPIIMMPAGVIYAGLYLELKRDGVKLRNRAGEWASPHIAKQAEVLRSLEDAGYIAQFAVGYDQAIGYIQAYLANPYTPTRAEDTSDLERDNAEVQDSEPIESF